MNITMILALASIATLAVPIHAQVSARRATLTGNRNSNEGKCTIEVVVDGVAEIEVRGDNGVLRNLSGQPPQWRRFECNAVMPANPANLRFQGIDGRGRQQLVRDPRNGGAAVVRIEDAGGGQEGYTFDLMWGGNGGNDYPRGPVSERGYPAEPRSYPPAEPRAYPRSEPGEVAIRACEREVRREAERRFGTPNISFGRIAVDDNPGRRDFVVGTLRADRPGRDENYRFSCAVNFESGRVRTVQIDPRPVMGDRRGYGDRGGSASTNAALQNCERAVEERVHRDGYRFVDFESINVDNNPGRNDWVVGSLKARQGAGSGFTMFSFSCSVDLRDGDVRSVDVRRR